MCVCVVWVDEYCTRKGPSMVALAGLALGHVRMCVHCSQTQTIQGARSHPHSVYGVLCSRRGAVVTTVRCDLMTQVQFAIVAVQYCTHCMVRDRPGRQHCHHQQPSDSVPDPRSGPTTVIGAGCCRPIWITPKTVPRGQNAPVFEFEYSNASHCFVGLVILS